MYRLLEKPVFSADNPAFVDYGEELAAEKERARLEFEESLLPIPESPQFKREIETPFGIIDHESGLKYTGYLVNRGSNGRPFDLSMAWSGAGGSGPGRKEVWAYAQRLDRPIYVVDHEGHGLSEIPAWEQTKSLTFDTAAEAHLRIVNQLGINDFDIGVFSMGGILAAKVAALAGERVKKLITVSTPSFEDTAGLVLAWNFVVKEGHLQRQYIKQAPPLIKEVAESGAGFAAKGKWASVPVLMRFFSLMREGLMPEVIEGLDPSTIWYDIVGSRDRITNWAAHYQAVTKRNQELPGSSSLHVLGSETHSVGTHVNAIADAVANLLEREEVPRLELPRRTRQVSVYDRAKKR